MVDRRSSLASLDPNEILINETDTLLERYSQKDLSSGMTVQQFAKTYSKMIGALLCLAGMIVDWIAMGELVQGLESRYKKPMFSSWIVHNGYGSFFFVWLAWYGFVGRNSPEYRNNSPSALYRLGTGTMISVTALFTAYFWYLSLPRTSVSANTAIYNSSSIPVFVLSVIMLGESVTIIKVISVLLSVGGITVVALWGQKKEKGVSVSWLGYVYVVLSMIMYSLYEVLYKRFGTAATGHGKKEEKEGEHQPKKETDSIWDTFLVLGLVGITNFLLFWPALIVLHFSGVEPFEWPSDSIWADLVITTVLDSLFNILLLLGIYLTNPLFISIGSLLTIPAGIVADYFFHHYTLPGLAFLGIGLIVLGFCGMSWSEYATRRTETDEHLSTDVIHSPQGTINVDYVDE